LADRRGEGWVPRRKLADWRGRGFEGNEGKKEVGVGGGYSVFRVSSASSSCVELCNPA
jgi:hypothetical protein